MSCLAKAVSRDELGKEIEMKKGLLLTGMTLIDGTGEEPLPNAAVLVREGKFERVGEKSSIENADAETVDLSGTFMLPGLINSHDHLYHGKTARGMAVKPRGISFSRIKALLKEEPEPYLVLLAARDAIVQLMEMGVTTVRDCGSTYGVSYHLKRAISEGVLPGPRLIICGQFIVMTGGHVASIGRGGVNSVADGREGIRTAVREQLGRGADFIKIMASGSFVTEPERGIIDIPAFTVEELQVAVEEAHQAGRMIAAHADGATGIRRSLKAGVDCIEHGLYLDAESVAQMVEQGTFLVPTLSGRMRIVDYIREVGDVEFADVIHRKEVVPNVKSFQLALEAGVKIGAGPDTQGELIRELEVFVENGMTPMQAVVSATRIGAEIAGISETAGTIEAGKVADFIVLERNPLVKISAFRKPKWVYQAGRKLSLDEHFEYSRHFSDWSS